MEEHFAAKRRLFEMAPADAPSIINVDDPRAQALLDVSRRAITYGINKPADVAPGPLSSSLEGLQFDARLPHGVVPTPRGWSAGPTSTTSWRPWRRRRRSTYRSKPSKRASASCRVFPPLRAGVEPR